MHPNNEIDNVVRIQSICYHAAKLSTSVDVLYLNRELIEELNPIIKEALERRPEVSRPNVKPVESGAESPPILSPPPCRCCSIIFCWVTFKADADCGVVRSPLGQWSPLHLPPCHSLISSSPEYETEAEA